MSDTAKVPEIPLIATPESDEARDALGFKWAGSDVGSRHKLGGKPDRLQEPDVPVCKQCRTPMTFYGQLDSVGDSISLADAGIVYVFVCFGCYETSSVLQSG